MDTDGLKASLSDGMTVRADCLPATAMASASAGRLRRFTPRNDGIVYGSA